MEPIRVLVMCQRKKSYHYDVQPGNRLSHACSVDITVKKIEKYIHEYYGTYNIQIEYMIDYSSHDKTLYDADYKLLFDPTSKDKVVRLESYDFIKNHCGHYDMIMLQTCPLSYFTQNFKYLPWIMKPDGVLTIKSFNAYYPESLVDISKRVPHAHAILMNYFDNINEDTFKVREPRFPMTPYKRAVPS